MQGGTLLQGVGITKRFGGLLALNDVDVEVKDGEILGLIGPNGSGKTTLFNIISGFYKPDRGRLHFRGREITGWKPHDVARLGIGRTFQIPQSFPSLSALENVAIGCLYAGGESRMKEARRRASLLLDRVGLGEKKHIRVKDLTLSEKKRLEIARALSTQPALLLLDEVFAGLTPAEIKEAIALIRHLRGELGLAVIIVEHIMQAVMAVCDRVMVLSYGRKIADGAPEEIATNPEVQEVYLGKAPR